MAPDVWLPAIRGNRRDPADESAGRSAVSGLRLMTRKPNHLQNVRLPDLEIRSRQIIFHKISAAHHAIFLAIERRKDDRRLAA